MRDSSAALGAPRPAGPILQEGFSFQLEARSVFELCASPRRTVGSLRGSLHQSMVRRRAATVAW